MSTLSTRFTKGALMKALIASLNLQSRYARTLNEQDGKHRRIFTTAASWIQRLEEIRSDGNIDNTESQ